MPRAKGAAEERYVKSMLICSLVHLYHIGTDRVYSITNYLNACHRRRNKGGVMTVLDWYMLGVYMVIVVTTCIRKFTVNQVDIYNVSNVVYYVLIGIGMLVSVYLIVRHPWYMLIWFILGSIVRIGYLLRRCNA